MVLVGKRYKVIQQKKKGMSPSGQKQEKTEIGDVEEIDELSGKLSMQNVEDKLMHSVLENDEEVINNAKIIKDSINQSISSFTPDMMFERLVQHYKTAEQIYGERLIRQMTGYDPNYVEKNVNIPEFQRELKKRIDEKIEELKEMGVLNKQGEITEKGVELAALELYIEELDELDAYGFLGEKLDEKQAHYGLPLSVRPYRKGDRYRDIAIRRSVKTAVRRQHTKLTKHDIKTFTRQAKGKLSIIYGLDASGSMKGEKIGVCKKAGVALAFKALQEKDDVGVVVFGQKVETAIAPCQDFSVLLKAMTRIHPSKETDLAGCILQAIPLFPTHRDNTKHLLLLTDAMPTVGDDPVKAALDAVEKAAAAGVTVSLIGIQLEEKGREFAEQVVQVGQGKLYLVQDLKDVGKIVLVDYYGHV
jgi:Mg-chelatase subunit ChlD